MIAARQIIEKRKELWQLHEDIERDREFVEAVKEHILESEPLRNEIREHPEYLIEMAFVIVDKNQQTVPFFLNHIQHSFINDLNQAIEDFKAGRRNHLKFLILKGRQGGFTSVITSYQLASSLVKKNFSGFTLADSGDNSNTIFEDKAKFPYKHLPDELRPTEKYNNRREFHFEKLNSRWRVATAGNKDVGRSKTINFFHGSEAAFWESLSTTLTGLGEALTKDSIQILETTANGFNEFKELCDDAQEGRNNWEFKFYEWWLTPEYRQNFENERIETWFKQQMQDSQEWIFTRIRTLVEIDKLEWSQVYWYYNKWKDLKEDIKQEYPCTPEEAFLASGKPVFDLEKVTRRTKELQAAQRTIKRGMFTYEYKNEKIIDRTIKWVDDETGPISIYEEAQPKRPYVIGGDTSGDGSDKFAGQILDNINGKQVAVLHHQYDEDLYARQMYCLGKKYNYALLSIEVNFSTYPAKELQRLGYARQYRRELIDNISIDKQDKYGFRTDSITRPVIIADLVQIVRESIELINDIPTLKEMITFIKNDQGKPEAQEGKNDDLIMALAIAYKARSQQSMSLIEDYAEPEYTPSFGRTGY